MYKNHEDKQFNQELDIGSYIPGLKLWEKYLALLLP